MLNEGIIDEDTNVDAIVTEGDYINFNEDEVDDEVKKDEVKNETNNNGTSNCYRCALCNQIQTSNDKMMKGIIRN